MKQLSIIVPIYNTEKYLRKCVDSLLEQDLDDYEILLINDSSPDSSIAIMKEYEERGDFAHSLVNENMIKGQKKS